MDDDVLTGFRFYPTEEELICFYLHNKLNGTRPYIDRVIPVLDIYDHNPQDLPRLGGEHSPAEGEQWFFFIPRQEREARGGRPNRLTAWGYWKATGSPAHVYSCQNRVIGRKRTMVFYVGRAPNGRKTIWKMNEYKAIQTHDLASSSSTPQLREELSLCRIYKRSKYLRAFDRRPTSETSRFNQQANPVVPEITDNCSFDSSSSGDHTANIIPSQHIIVESVTEEDNQPFWDLEQLDWD